MRERVQKILARTGIGSRRKCEELIAEGRVSVNRIIIKLGDKADPEKDDIRVDNSRILRAEAKKYYAVNKPRGIVSTLSDPEGRLTVAQFVPQKTRVYPVGRLDRDAEGLILMTNDGELANRLMHPRYETPKTYQVTLTGKITQEQVQKLRKGVRVQGRIVGIERVAIHTPSNVEITLHEGRKHIVKRLFRKIGHTVARLKRTQVANIKLKDLPSGQYRELTSAELAGLRRMALDKAEQRAGPA
jgi:pseudouridine synthase